MGISVWQILIILLIVVLLFGAGKIPRLMGDLAKGIKSFKHGMKEEEETAGEAPRTIEGQSTPTASGKVHRDEVAKS